MSPARSCPLVHPALTLTALNFGGAPLAQDATRLEPAAFRFRKPAWATLPTVAAVRPIGLEVPPDLPGARKGPTRPRGFLVVGVSPRGPAERQGVREGLVLTHAAGHAVRSLDDFRGALADHKDARPLSVLVVSGDRALRLDLLNEDDAPPARQEPPSR